GGGGMTRLVVQSGEQRGMRPKDLVGAIANEAKIAGDSIRAIEIREQYSLVEVREVDADKVIRALSRATLRGQKVVVRREDER
ncbi:MAG: DbpA RNA binding domain-containing protein, partial [Ilumatobacteraceae bacterium]